MRSNFHAPAGLLAPIGEVLLGPSVINRAAWQIEVCSDPGSERAYALLRHAVFVEEQGLFAHDDHDEVDDDPRRIVLVARSANGEVIGGVRLAPATPGRDIGWWIGGRLAVAPGARSHHGIGAALVRAACAHAQSNGVIRFDANVQLGNAELFDRLGWTRVRDIELHNFPHILMRFSANRFADLVQATKSDLGSLLTGFQLGGEGFVGDDGAPVPGTDLVAACDAIVAAMVERDPEWAGWCSVLVNVNDLSAMGATPVGLLDSVAARDSSFAARIIAGIRRASEAYAVPVLGGHTQLAAPAALSVTALGRTDHPIPAGGGQVGDRVSLTTDVGGEWRPGYSGRQWDSTSHRTAAELQQLLTIVRVNRPASAKDVSMAGVVGTLGMMAEASGCGAVLDVNDVPTPVTASMGDWLTCFPGFGMLTADRPGQTITGTGVAVSAPCAELTTGAGVSLRWPDGEVTTAITGGVTGLGPA